LEAVGPLLFVILIAVMAILSFLGILRADSASALAQNRIDDHEQ
jgi:hypothetical protein